MSKSVRARSMNGKSRSSRGSFQVSWITGHCLGLRFNASSLSLVPRPAHQSMIARPSSSSFFYFSFLFTNFEDFAFIVVRFLAGEFAARSILDSRFVFDFCSRFLLWFSSRASSSEDGRRYTKLRTNRTGTHTSPYSVVGGARCSVLTSRYPVRVPYPLAWSCDCVCPS